MAERRPLVKVSGRTKELPAGDTLPSSGGLDVPAATKWETYAATEPTGWFFLNGQTISEAGNPTLAAIFGASGGLVTLPNEIGRGSKMAGGGNAVGDHAGSDTVNLSHHHAVDPPQTSTQGHASEDASIGGLLATSKQVDSDTDSPYVDIPSFDSSDALTTTDVRGAVTYINWIIKGG